jgi:putative PIN family toxin of toxin-antitoxin system
MRRIVLDTSVLIAAVRSRRGASNKLLSLVGQGHFVTVVSVPLLFEFEDTLMREAHQIHYTSGELMELLDFICAHSEPQPIYYLWRPLLPDPGDDLVLEVAVAGGCDTIVTFNLRHFLDVERFGMQLQTPGAFLKEIET